MGQQQVAGTASQGKADLDFQQLQQRHQSLNKRVDALHSRGIYDGDELKSLKRERLTAKQEMLSAQGQQS